MSSVVIDLQRECLDGNTDIVDLLRKSLLVARKLKLSDFEIWVRNELNGYKSTDEVPDYRIIFGQLKGFNPYHGWVDTVLPDNEIENMINNQSIIDSIPKIQMMLKSKDQMTIIPLNSELCALISQFFNHETRYAIFIDKGALYDIIEKTKSLILDWSITLEENGILGENPRFSEKEKNIAKINHTISNYINIFYGEVSKPQLQQGTDNSTQKNTNDK